MELARSKLVSQGGQYVRQGGIRSEDKPSNASLNMRPVATGRNFSPPDDYSREYAENRARLMVGRSAGFQGGQPQDDDAIEQKNKQLLHEKRQQYRSMRQAAPSAKANEIRAMAGTLSPMEGLSLLKQINLMGDFPYMLAFFSALLKDISDFVLIGSLPGVGTVLSICCSIFIVMMMLIVGAGEKKKVAGTWVKKIITLSGGTILEMLPVIDFIPVETLTVGGLYLMTLVDRKNSQGQ